VKPLLISVDDIDGANQPWSGKLSVADLDEVLGGEPPTGYAAARPVEVQARLTRLGRKVLLQARFGVGLAGVCKRCLKELSLEAPVETTLTFVPSPKAGRASGRRGRPPSTDS
jgi:uncharacterized protein